MVGGRQGLPPLTAIDTPVPGRASEPLGQHGRISSRRACCATAESVWLGMFIQVVQPAWRVPEHRQAPCAQHPPVRPSLSAPPGAQQVQNILRGSLCLGGSRWVGVPRDWWCRFVSGLERRMGVSALLVPEGEGVPRRVLLGQ